MSVQSITKLVGRIAARPLGVWLFFIGLAFLLYGNTLLNGYCVDDQLIIEGHEQAHKGFGGITEILTTNYLTQGQLKGSYRALPRISLAIEYAIFGENPSVSHLINVVLFGLTGVVVYQFVLLLFPDRGSLLAFFTATLFLAHPIHTEVVASIKNRDELFSFLFGLSACLNFLKFYRFNSLIALSLGALLFLCSLMSKESGQQFLAMVPLTLLVAGPLQKKPFAIAFAAPIAVSALFWGVLSVILPPGTTTWMAAARSQAGFPFVEHPLLYVDDLNIRLGTAFYSMAYYLRLLVLPHPLGFFYGFDQIPLVGMSNPISLLSLAGHVWLGLYGLLNIRKLPEVSFAMLAYLVCLSMFSNLIIPMSGIVGERFIYSSSFSFCLFLGWLFSRPFEVGHASLPSKKTELAPSRSPKAAIFLGGFTLLVLGYSARAIARNFNWKDRLTLVTHDAQVFERSGITQLMAGMLWEKNARSAHGPERAGMFRKAASYYARVAKIDSTYIVPLRLTGYIYANDLGQHEMATQWFKKVLAQAPNDHEIHNALGWSYAHIKQPKLAIDEYSTAIRLSPQWALPHINRGLLLLDLGNFEAALSDFDSAIAIDPTNANAWNNRGWCYFQLNKIDKAMDDFDRAIVLDPQLALAFNNRGLIKLTMGQAINAIHDFEMALTIDPNMPYAYLNRAKAYLQEKNRDLACRDLTSAAALGNTEAMELKNKVCL